MTFTLFLNSSLSWLTLIAQIISLKILFAIIFSPKNGIAPVGFIQKSSVRIINFFKGYALHTVFIVSLIAMLGSLSYSDVLGYAPCALCWYQRILMYPQVLLAFIALMIKDRRVLIYTLSLSIVGAGFSFYHYMLQIGLVPAPCSSIGYSVSCSQTFTLRLGYITIPMMAFAAFVLNAIVSCLGYFSDKNTEQPN